MDSEAAQRPEKLRIVLAEDNDALRRSFVLMLNRQPDFEVIGEAQSGEMAIEQARDLRPDVVLMDYGLPGISGIEATKIIAREMPEVRVIGLSMHDEDMLGASMREAGAAGYLPKHLPTKELIQGIRNIGAMKR